MNGYDQWKTASPYDDEPDPYEEAYAFLKHHKETDNGDLLWAVFVIDGLLDCLEENGVSTK